MADYEEAIKRPFSDLWKLVIGVILSIFPVINWIAQGYVIENSGLGRARPAKKMPEWKDLGYYFVKGFLFYVITFVYMIPALIVFLAAVGYAAASLATAFIGILPQGFFSSLMAGQIGEAEINQLISQHWMLIFPTILTLAPMLLIGLVLMVVGLYLSPMGVLNYVRTKKFVKAFDLGAVYRKTFNAEYLIAWIMTGLIFGLIRTVLFFLPFVNQAIAFFVSGVIAYTLFGQIYRDKK